MSYSNGIQMTYTVSASAILSAAGQAGNFAGPAGMTGRLVAIAAVVTTGVTVAAGSVTLRDKAATQTYGSLSVPVLAADAVANGLVIDDSSDTPTDTAFIPADTALELDGDGAATAGAADFHVTIEWS